MSSSFPFSVFILFAACSAARPLRGGTGPSDAGPPPVEKLSPFVVSENSFAAIPDQLPQAAVAISADRIDETVNIVDTEDAVKYFPSIFIRKRNYGDTQPVMATRTWGVNSSARSLVYADGILLTALIANNNTLGAPRWGLIAPAEIAGIEVLYGPFSAAYPGNSMGAVMEIVTRMPTKREASLAQTEAWQTFGQYGTSGTYRTHQTAVTLGDRHGKLSYWISANYQDSFSQPLTYVTSPAFPQNTSGGYAARNKFGQSANIVGAGGLLHTKIANAKLKLAFDLTPTLRAAYTLGYWTNSAHARSETYLRDDTGLPTYAGLGGFASGTYRLHQAHTAQSLVVRSDTRGVFDWEASASLYHIGSDTQRSPASAPVTGTTFGSTGKIARLDGTGWSTLDLKGIWRARPASELSFGAHQDIYRLINPTYHTPDWSGGGPPAGLATEGDGRTRTQALWAQEVWRFAPGWKVTVGARSESWEASDGYNVNGATALVQPSVSSSGFSPKVSLAWSPSAAWTLTASFGEAYRFPTTGELYQLVSTGATYTSPNPDLLPEHVYAAELKAERTLGHSHVRLSLFQERVKHALVSQYAPLAASSLLYQYVMNVDRVRARGVEIVVGQDDVLVRGLSFSGSVTYVNDRILANSGQGRFGSALGKRMPYVPSWRFTAVATYRPGPRWTFTAAGRYSGPMDSTVDNTDVNPNTYGGFASFFVADLRARFQVNRRWAASVGIDNALDRSYFLYHPFPQRTFVGELTCTF
jgi:iron complex outermembrane receptor protein